MQEKSGLLGRREFMNTGIRASMICLLPLVRNDFHNGETWARLKMTMGKRSLGLKISSDSEGNIYVSIRELNKRKLVVIPLGKPRGRASTRAIKEQFKLRDGAEITVNMSQFGVISSNLKEVMFGKVETETPAPSGEGLFAWLKDRANDAVAAIGAGLTYLTGQWGLFRLSGGGEIYVEGGNGTITYQAGAGGFKLEPGMEEKPNVWY